LDKYDQLQAQESTQTGNSGKAQQKLRASIELLRTALDDYPDHEDNDKVLYQLVTAYDKQSEPEQAQVAMRQLVDNYPQSRFYTEMQFKLGEKYLTTNDSIDAELAYTAAIQRENPNSSFYWRALYKRGWSRLRQSVYEDALDDFFQVLTLSGLADKSALDAGDSELYTDILRGISLCFANMGGLDRLNEYFTKHSNSPYAYLAYQELGQMYESQDRVYDAVEVYQAYITHNEKSSYAPKFLIKIIRAWEKGGQTKKALQARNELESRYSIQSAFWDNNDINQYKNIREALEANAVYMASHYHGLYQQSRNRQYLQSAKYWYERFVKYDSRSNSAADTYFMYAELLTESGESDKALAYYEKADQGNVDLQAKKEAAYAAVVTANKIYEKNKNTDQHEKWLARKVDYTLSFIKKYPGDQRSLDATLHIVGNLYSQKKYKKTIEIIGEAPQAIKIRINADLELYKAHCLFALNDFESAEKIYTALRNGGNDQNLDKQMLADRLASSIYKQGEVAEKNGKSTEAVKHYLRVYQKVPQSQVAATAEFDAATLLIKQNKNEKAIQILENFVEKFKNHRLQASANNKLAMLYLDGADNQKSALAFERAAKDKSNDNTIRRDALWQAAELNEKIKNITKAISLYKLYAQEFASYHEPAMEAKSRLAGLYRQTNETDKKNAVLLSMVNAESKIRHNMSTERTRYLAANAALELIEPELDAYYKVKIRKPLKVTLKRKKAALQSLVKQLTKVTDYAIEETTTQAIYHIAEAYNDFSRALINSPRPANLKDLELQQYELLLEEQAFPFEEKALSFYKENLKVIKEGVYNKWVKNSFDRLTKLVPARYNKHEKLDSFIDIPLEPVGASN
jgi:TolA-binding protein/outer membrane protein assembly factor BamD (BamD/ComL family)